jgi:hypothetical protein
MKLSIKNTRYLHLCSNGRALSGKAKIAPGECEPRINLHRSRLLPDETGSAKASHRVMILGPRCAKLGLTETIKEAYRIMAPLASTMFIAHREVLPEHEQMGSSQDMRRALNAVLMVAPADSAAFDPTHGLR